MKPFLLLLLLFALLVPARAQMHYIGSGSIMEPRFRHADLIAVWPRAYAELKAGDLVAFRLDTHLVASRLVSLQAGNWVTRALAAKQDDVGVMTEKTYMGIAALDLYTENTWRANWQPDISLKDLYILSPYMSPTMSADYLDAFTPGVWTSPYIAPFVPIADPDDCEWRHGHCDSKPPVSPPVDRVPDGGALVVPLAVLMGALCWRRRFGA